MIANPRDIAAFASAAFGLASSTAINVRLKPI
jgi:hypothetical protein